jgi:hypothetical protein
MDSLERSAERVRRLVEAARTIADPASSLGKLARQRLPPATGLSPEGVEFALERSLEIDATPAEVAALCRATPAAPRAHVLLSANVFVAALRAIALALAASPEVAVRCSRREAVMADLLWQAYPGFRIVDELDPEPGDHVWAYGSDDTMAELRRTLPRGVVFHGHGSGIGLAAVAPEDDEQLELAVNALAEDVALFDQRGCASPRLLLGPPGILRPLAQRISRALEELERRIPRGALTPDEKADDRRFRDSAVVAFELFDAGSGAVTLDQNGERWLVPPAFRNLHVAGLSGIHALSALEPAIVAVGVRAPEPWVNTLRKALPRARLSALGSMQRPRLDGPLDLRTPPAGEVLI